MTAHIKSLFSSPHALFAWISLLFLATASPADAPPCPEGNLIENCDFESGEDWPDGWPEEDHLSWEGEPGQRYLRITAEPGDFVNIYRWFRVEEYAGQAMELTVTARTDVVPGSEGWHNARIIMHFKNHEYPWEGSNVSPSPGTMGFPASTDGEWVTQTREFHVPEGARSMELMPALPHVQSGTFDLMAISLRPIEAEILHEPPVPPESPEEQAEEVGDLFDEPLPPMLKVVGNEIHDEAGNVVSLQGVSIPSLEWNPGGENILQSFQVAIDDWNVNVIRLPVSDTFWFGRGTGWTSRDDHGRGYRELVDECIRLAATRGVYVVLDLHVYRAPTLEHAQFWEYAALRYKNHPAVIFGIMNEPHGTSWEVWRNGGEIARDGVRVPTVGQQGLVDVVRSTGARNIIVAGGLDWAYDLSGIAEGYALEDRPEANGIMYDTHIYNWKRDWEGKVLVIAEDYPILVGEWGAQPVGQEFDFVPTEAQEDPETWIPDMIGFIQKHNLHQTAWCFHPSSSPELIKDMEDYEPTEHFGRHVKDMLHGKQFEMERMR